MRKLVREICGISMRVTSAYRQKILTFQCRCVSFKIMVLVRSSFTEEKIDIVRREERGRERENMLLNGKLPPSEVGNGPLHFIRHWL